MTVVRLRSASEHTDRSFSRALMLQSHAQDTG